MNTARAFDIAALIVGVAALTTIFARPNSYQVINALGSAFSGSISAALGKGVTFS